MHGFLPVEKILVVDAVFDLGVKGEVSYAEGGQILEEVGALTRLDEVVRQSCFDNESCGRYVWPLDRYAQGGVARPPASGAYEYVVLSPVEECLVDFSISRAMSELFDDMNLWLLT